MLAPDSENKAVFALTKGEADKLIKLKFERAKALIEARKKSPELPVHCSDQY